eukprot:3112458-Prymnesium_polylepis.1
MSNRAHHSPRVLSLTPTCAGHTHAAAPNATTRARARAAARDTPRTRVPAATRGLLLLLADNRAATQRPVWRSAATSALRAATVALRPSTSALTPPFLPSRGAPPTAADAAVAGGESANASTRL